MSCPCCVLDYNKGIRTEVKCYFDDCKYSVCKECIRTYLTGTTNEPHCMKCRKKWDQEFTKVSLNSSFMQKEYREHRKKILVDRTISQIQEYYPEAILISKRRKDQIEIDKIGKEIGELQRQISEKYRQINTIRNTENKKISSEDRRKFVMPCQTNGCRGMLSTAYKCELCEKYTCHKCLESIIGNKDEHICIKENVDTAEEIRKNTRPCPKCGCRISKIDGCDQMWCIECKTAFSWSKGTIEVGNVHNPHYFQWMRQNGGRADRNPREGCNEILAMQQMDFIKNFLGLLDTLEKSEHTFIENSRHCGYSLDELRILMPSVYNNVNIIKSANKCDELRRIKKSVPYIFFMNFYRFIIHTQNVTYADLNRKIRERNNDNSPIHYYILGERTREELSDYLIKRDISNTRDGAHRDILEALIMVGKQILNDLYNELSQIELGFSWNLIRDELNSMRPPRGITSGDYIKDTMRAFSDYYTRFYLPHIENIENLYRKCYEITNKYIVAINNYSTYANLEILKYLMLYATRKNVELWDPDLENFYNFNYDTKDSLLKSIEKHKKELEKYSNQSYNSSNGGGGGGGDGNI